MSEAFGRDWLALREPFDRAARSLRLAQQLGATLPRRPRLVDLGGGTGSLFRYLAPIIGRGQDWSVIDADAALLDEAFGITAAWARRQGFAATAEGDTLLLSTPRGLWRMRTVQRDIASAPEGIASDYSADAVVCSALLDLVSPAWLRRLSQSLQVPLLACLAVDGRDTWRPLHPLDAKVGAAFRRDMQRDKGFGPALGTGALRAVQGSGLVAITAPSDWRIPRTSLGMQRALIDGTAAAARRAAPAQAGAITAWQTARLRQALRGRLAITIGHRDILVLPSGG